MQVIERRDELACGEIAAGSEDDNGTGLDCLAVVVESANGCFVGELDGRHRGKSVRKQEKKQRCI
jgi:hypothetical protein